MHLFAHPGFREGSGFQRNPCDDGKLAAQCRNVPIHLSFPLQLQFHAKDASLIRRKSYSGFH
jgi:hypothetical protein